MTEVQQKQISELRRSGYGYKKIAQIMGIPDSTVKSFCKRNDLIPPPAMVSVKEGCCPQCGSEIAQSGKTKKRRFCSDECRKLWWKDHPNLSSAAAVYRFVCLECGAHFSSYGNNKRKFCCHGCYVEHRMKAGGYHDK